MLIPFPIALLFAVLACDLFFWATWDPGWTIASLWLLGAALFTAALAAIAGLVDFTGDARIRAISDSWHHMIGNVAAVFLSLGNFWLRYQTGDAFVVPTGLALSAIVVLLLVYTGWRAGNMIYHHRIGVLDQPTSGQG
jgi:uncharacterized membrane protein